MKIVAGKKLRSGGTVGVIALSAPGEGSRIEAGISALKEYGLQVKVALAPAEAFGKTEFLFSSDSPQNRIAGLSELLSDPKVDVILAVRGAHGSMELLETLPIETIRNAGKILCGFSDTTALLIPWVQKAGIVAIHGPSLEATFAKKRESGAYRTSGDTLISLLKGEILNPFSSFSLSVVAGKGDVEGTLIGGNLSILASLMGTPWEPSFEDTLLFIEEVKESPFRIHRMLLQLKLAGAFKKVRGVIFGHLTQCVHSKNLGPTTEDVLLEIFRDAPFPVVRGLPSGHEPLNLPIPFGVRARLTPNHLELLGDVVLS